MPTETFFTGNDGIGGANPDRVVPAADPIEQLNVLGREISAEDNKVQEYIEAIKGIGEQIKAGELTVDTMGTATRQALAELENAAGGSSEATDRLCDAAEKYLASLVEKTE